MKTKIKLMMGKPLVLYIWQTGFSWSEQGRHMGRAWRGICPWAALCWGQHFLGMLKILGQVYGWSCTLVLQCTVYLYFDAQVTVSAAAISCYDCENSVPDRRENSTRLF